MKLRPVKYAFATVFRSPKYVLGAVALSFAFFFIFIIANNIPFFLSSVREWSANPLLLVSYIVYLARMILANSGVAALASILAVSILASINISMIIYRLRRSGMSNQRLNAMTTRKSFSLGISGILGGALSSGCPACSATLISLLGVSGGLAIFPFKGLELSLISIIVVLASLYFVSKSLAVNCGSCKIA